MTNIIPKESIQSALRSYVCSVFFVKKDGSHRLMKCTLLPEKLPARVSSSTSTSVSPETAEKAYPDILSVFDIEKQAWRSFHVSSVFGLVMHLENNEAAK